MCCKPKCHIGSINSKSYKFVAFYLQEVDVTSNTVPIEVSNDIALYRNSVVQFSARSQFICSKLNHSDFVISSNCINCIVHIKQASYLHREDSL